MTAITTLTWGIKESLLGYVESLEDGEITLEGGAVREGNTFTFPVGESDVDAATGEGTVQCVGTVVLSGYHGQMTISFADPRVTVSDGRGTLAIRVQSMFTGESFVPIAALTVTTTTPEIVASAVLTAQGQPFFGPQYQPGQELSPVTLS